LFSTFTVDKSPALPSSGRGASSRRQDGHDDRLEHYWEDPVTRAEGLQLPSGVQAGKRRGHTRCVRVGSCHRPGPERRGGGGSRLRSNVLNHFEQSSQRANGGDGRGRSTWGRGALGERAASVSIRPWAEVLAVIWATALPAGTAALFSR